MPGRSPIALLRTILFVMAFGLQSCATRIQEIENAPAPIQASPVPETKKSLAYLDAPPQISSKNGKELKLVRAMEGGACNAKDQGAKGVFLVYADPNDIERIKTEKGAGVFQQYESRIERFSLLAFQESVAATNIADNPFALDNDDAQKQVTQQLTSNFAGFSKSAISHFESSTGLTIDVVPFSPSMVFLLEECNAVLQKAPQPI